MSDRKAHNRKQTIDGIQKAIEQLQASQGKLSISAVAKMAGVTPALIHNTYPDLAEKIRGLVGKATRTQRDAKHGELVRESESNPGENSISLRFEGKVRCDRIEAHGCLIKRQVYHYRVSKGASGIFISKDSVFQTMSELIEHHSKKADGLIVPLKVCALYSLCCVSLSLAQHVVAKKEAKGVAISKEMEDKWELDRNEITLAAKLGSGQYGEVYEGFWKKFNIKVRYVC